MRSLAQPITAEFDTNELQTVAHPTEPPDLGQVQKLEILGPRL